MPSARAATRSPLVLMADAHEWFSRALESVLVPGGYSVVKAYTAAGLLQQLELTEPDALILAVDLPGGEGLNLCRMLRADSLVTPSTPIILTQPTPSTRRQTLAALRAGAAELWGQRLDAEELLLRLAAQNRAKADADRAWAEGLVDHATQLYNGRGIARRAATAYRPGGGIPGGLRRRPRRRRPEIRSGHPTRARQRRPGRCRAPSGGRTDSALRKRRSADVTPDVWRRCSIVERLLTSVPR